MSRFAPCSWLCMLIAALAGVSCTTSSVKPKVFDPYAVKTATAAELVKTKTSGTLDPSMLVPSYEPFRLGPGDVIDIELLGSGDGPQRTFVGPDGKIYFHLLAGQQVWGLTLGETQRLLESGLTQFVHQPQLSITLREVHSRRVWVLGRVNTPGLYELSQPMTVIEAVSKAGGLFTSRMSGSTEELADLYHSFLIRKGKLVPVDFNKLIRSGDTSQNIYLQADDFIYLPSALGSEVYVMGAVYQPRAVAFKDQVTLMTALAHCRGFIKGAKTTKVAIVRGSLQEPEIAIVDAEAILTGRQPDVLLKPKDLVYVPETPPASLSGYADLVITTFARTVAANEGARAGGATKPLGVNIGVGQ
ncbi:MAG: polysaccharide export protein [Akkermansiaceae bacterium]|nr:polysaccharide export protein [Akkermansiaceae bacterium]